MGQNKKVLPLKKRCFRSYVLRLQNIISGILRTYHASLQKTACNIIIIYSSIPKPRRVDRATCTLFVMASLEIYLVGGVRALGSAREGTHCCVCEIAQEHEI